MTSDGQFVICITSAWRSRGRGQDEFISVVGLADFKVVASVRSPTVAALAGDYRLHDLDRQNRLVIQAHGPFPRHPGDDITAGGSRVKMAVLSVPSLVVASQCEYTEWIRTRSPTRREDQGSCEDLLATYGDTTNLADLINTLLGSGEVSRTDLDRRPSQCAFLGYARYLSPDGRYEREICQTDHRGFWGTPVITKSVENIFSVKTGEQVGSIDEPITSVESRFAPVNGQEYLLVMEGGTRLMIYRIAD